MCDAEKVHALQYLGLVRRGEQLGERGNCPLQQVHKRQRVLVVAAGEPQLDQVFVVLVRHGLLPGCKRLQVELGPPWLAVRRAALCAARVRLAGVLPAGVHAARLGVRAVHFLLRELELLLHFGQLGTRRIEARLPRVCLELAAVHEPVGVGEHELGEQRNGVAAYVAALVLERLHGERGDAHALRRELGGQVAEACADMDHLGAHKCGQVQEALQEAVKEAVQLFLPHTALFAVGVRRDVAERILLHGQLADHEALHLDHGVAHWVCLTVEVRLEQADLPQHVARVELGHAHEETCKAARRLAVDRGERLGGQLAEHVVAEPLVVELEAHERKQLGHRLREVLVVLQRLHNAGLHVERLAVQLDGKAHDLEHAHLDRGHLEVGLVLLQQHHGPQHAPRHERVARGARRGPHALGHGAQHAGHGAQHRWDGRRPGPRRRGCGAGAAAALPCTTGARLKGRAVLLGLLHGPLQEKRVPLQQLGELVEPVRIAARRLRHLLQHAVGAAQQRVQQLVARFRAQRPQVLYARAERVKQAEVRHSGGRRRDGIDRRVDHRELLLRQLPVEQRLILDLELALLQPQELVGEREPAGVSVVHRWRQVLVPARC